MKDKLREFLKTGTRKTVMRGESGRYPNGEGWGHSWNEEVVEFNAKKLDAALIDAEGDGGAVPVAVQTRYQGPNKTVNTDWRPCSFAHAQAVKDARCDVTEIRYLYTYPARSGVVSDEDVHVALERFTALRGESPINAMRAALETFMENRK